MKWSFRWHDDETVVLSSSDIGTRAWRIVDGNANEFPLPLPPELLDPTQPLSNHQRDRRKRLVWPEESVGTWIEFADDSGVSIRIEKPKFQHMWELPDEGYVPVEAMGPTVVATVHNDSARYVADVRIHLRAIGPTGFVIARDDTDDASGISLIAPGEADERTFVFDGVDTPLDNSKEWGNFEIAVDPVAARFVDLADIEVQK